jgi:hypothetical protein
VGQELGKKFRCRDFAGASSSTRFILAAEMDFDQRRKIRAEEKGVAATDVHKIRSNVIDATNTIRREMTEKYRMEF